MVHSPAFSMFTGKYWSAARLTWLRPNCFLPRPTCLWPFETGTHAAPTNPRSVQVYQQSWSCWILQVISVLYSCCRLACSYCHFLMDMAVWPSKSVKELGLQHVQETGLPDNTHVLWCVSKRRCGTRTGYDCSLKTCQNQIRRSVLHATVWDIGVC